MKDLSQIHQQNAEWLEDLFDHAHDLIQIVAVDGTLLYVNKSWTTLLGYSKSELQGKKINVFIDPKDRLQYQEFRSQVISGKVADGPIVFKMQAKSGQSFTVEGVINLKEVEGVPQYTIGIFRDVSHRIQSEMQLQHLNQELREREHNLKQLLIQAPDAVVVIDQDSCIQFWNPKAEALFGWTAEEVLDKDLSSIIVPLHYREAHSKGMKRYLETGETRVLNKTIEITALHRRGHEFYVALTISATQQGGKTVFIAFIRDISEQKQSQQELERKTKQLEKSNDHLEDFAHAASHDLKEPLRKIRFFSERLRTSLDGQLPEEGDNLLERIEVAAERMQLLVEDLLEFSHVSEQPQELEAIDLNDKVQKVLLDLELSIEEKQAQIFVSELPTVQGNRRQIQQLFYNLIGNALKYNKPDIAPIIIISATVIKGSDAPIDISESDSNTPYHLIEVRDNGIGFEQQYANKIFKMFQRLHGKGQYSGTGVGLAIVRKVVENHKGHIWAESTPGEGAIFKVLIPINIETFN